jgi:hypothetical protein
MARYFLTRDGEPEREVTKEEWVRVERQAGFVNVQGKPYEPATASWSVPGLRGRIEPLAPT